MSIDRWGSGIYVESESGVKAGSASFAETDATRDRHVKGKNQDSATRHYHWDMAYIGAHLNSRPVSIMSAL